MCVREMREILFPSSFLIYLIYLTIERNATPLVVNFYILNVATLTPTIIFISLFPLSFPGVFSLYYLSIFFTHLLSPFITRDYFTSLFSFHLVQTFRLQIFSYLSFSYSYIPLLDSSYILSKKSFSGVAHHISSIVCSILSNPQRSTNSKSYLQ